MEVLGWLLKAPVFVLSLLLLLTIIVFVHEFGHFITARLLGVRVEAFSLGFGKPIWRWTDRHGTEWRISWLPLGGYVKFFGDLNAASQSGVEEQKPVTTQFPNPSDKDRIAGGMTAEERAQCFHFKPVWRRAAIVAAGPISNFLLAAFIFAGFFMLMGRGTLEPYIGGVAPDSPAAAAGLQAGDRLVAVNGQTVRRFEELYDIVPVSGGDPLTISVDRDGASVTVTVSPQRVEDTDRYGNRISRWQLGIAPPGAEYYSYRKLPPGEALAAGFAEVGRLLKLTVKFLYRIVAGQEDASQLGGPIKMAQYAGQSMMSGFAEAGPEAQAGFLERLRVSVLDFVFLAAVVSVSIGFLNLLPVPVLDGGHLMYYAYEAVAGRPMGARLQAIGFRVGFALVASLMLFVTWNDINNILSSIS